MSEVKLSQRDDIIRHLMTEGSITAWEAIKEYGSTRLSAIVYELRKKGWVIESEPVTAKNRYGNPVTFVRYRFKSKATDQKTQEQPKTNRLLAQLRFERLLRWFKRGK